MDKLDLMKFDDFFKFLQSIGNIQFPFPTSNATSIDIDGIIVGQVIESYELINRTLKFHSKKEKDVHTIVYSAYLIDKMGAVSTTKFRNVILGQRACKLCDYNLKENDIVALKNPRIMFENSVIPMNSVIASDDNRIWIYKKDKQDIKNLSVDKLIDKSPRIILANKDDANPQESNQCNVAKELYKILCGADDASEMNVDSHSKETEVCRKLPNKPSVQTGSTGDEIQDSLQTTNLISSNKSVDVCGKSPDQPSVQIGNVGDKVQDLLQTSVFSSYSSNESADEGMKDSILVKFTTIDSKLWPKPLARFSSQGHFLDSTIIQLVSDEVALGFCDSKCKRICDYHSFKWLIPSSNDKIEQPCCPECVPPQKLKVFFYSPMKLQIANGDILDLYFISENRENYFETDPIEYSRSNVVRGLFRLKVFTKLHDVKAKVDYDFLSFSGIIYAVFHGMETFDPLSASHGGQTTQSLSQLTIEKMIT